MKKLIKYGRLLFLLAAFALLCTFSVTVLGEEVSQDTEEETEYIPEAYYDPIQSNELKNWPQGQAVQAGAATVMDLDTNAFLYSKNAYEKMYPASITKIMTAMIVLEHVGLDEEITFSEIVYDIEADSSHAGIKPGEKMTIRQALNALMLESANDAANGLAEYVAGSVEAFADLMNQKAQELGCVNTHFTNPHGLHNENHYTCAYDMSLISQAAYEIPEFRELVSTTLFYCPETNMTEEERYFLNHHQMIQEDSEYYQEWCKGGKNGFTTDAWNTLVTFGEKNGLRLVCVLLRENGANQAYLETTDLMNYGFDQFSQKQVSKGGDFSTFYGAMDLDYPGKASRALQDQELRQPIAVMDQPGIVTLPNSFTGDEVTASVTVSGTEAVISYSYEDWHVGSGAVRLTPMEAQVTLPFAGERDVETISHSASESRRQELEQTALTVMNQTQEFVNNVYEKVTGYVENNTLTVVCVGIGVLLLLILVIVILVIRCTRESRIKMRRRQADRERLRIEEEIDRKTASEIEQELRAAMEEERKRQQRQAARMEEERREEEKLRETEKILEEINQQPRRDRK